MHDSLAPGETIQLQLNGAQVIAMVRYCRSNGDQFVIGVERVDEWSVEPRIATELAPPSNAGADGSPRTLGRPKVNYLNRLTAVATRQLFADSFGKGEHYSPKIARIALATVAALLAALLGLYCDRVLVRARGNSAPPAFSNAKYDRGRDPGNQPDANHHPPSAQAPSEAQSKSARERIEH
jgi:hypothetical protein